MISSARAATSRRPCSPVPSARTSTTVCSSTGTRQSCSRERASRGGYPAEQRAGAERPGPQGRERARVSEQVATTLAMYEQVLGMLRDQIEAIQPGDRDNDTPCAEWTTTLLVSHVVSAIEYYGRLSTGAAGVRPVRIELGAADDLLAAFDAAAAD